MDISINQKVRISRSNLDMERLIRSNGNRYWTSSSRRRHMIPLTRPSGVLSTEILLRTLPPWWRHTCATTSFLCASANHSGSYLPESRLPRNLFPAHRSRVPIYETDAKSKGPCIEKGNLIAETAMMTLEGKKIIVTGMSKHLENPVTAIARPYYRLLYS